VRALEANQSVAHALDVVGALHHGDTFTARSLLLRMHGFL